MFNFPNTEKKIYILNLLVEFSSLIPNGQNFQLKPLGNQKPGLLKFWSILQCKARYSKEEINENLSFEILLALICKFVITVWLVIPYEWLDQWCAWIFKYSNIRIKWCLNTIRIFLCAISPVTIYSDIHLSIFGQPNIFEYLFVSSSKSEYIFYICLGP